MNNTHEYTDAQLQAAIDAALKPRFHIMEGTWNSRLVKPDEFPAIARAFLAALPQAEPDPYARLKAYAKAGARIRYRDCGGDLGPWVRTQGWSFDRPLDRYEVHPDDLHMVPEYAPAKPMESPQGWTLPAPPAGFRWHREDWTADMLPEGTRPLLDGEHSSNETAQFYKGEWLKLSDSVIARQLEDHLRTRRPLPAPSAEPEQPLPDDGPAWIPHDGGPCPLKDEEVEEWECEWDDETTTRWSAYLPPSQCEVWDSMRAYRVLKWKPGHGPAEPPKAKEPEQAKPDDIGINGLTDAETQATASVAGLSKPTQAPAAPTEAAEAKPAVHVPKGMRLLSVESPEFDCLPEGSMCLLKEHGTTYPWEKSHYVGERVPVTLRKDCYYAVPAKPTQSPQDWTPRPGDVVRLKSGGPEMTVTGVCINLNYGLYHACLEWFEAGRVNRGDASLHSLQPAKEEARP